MGVGRGFAHRITRVPLFTIRSSSTSASGLGWVNIGPASDARPGFRELVWRGQPARP